MEIFVNIVTFVKTNTNCKNLSLYQICLCVFKGLHFSKKLQVDSTVSLLSRYLIRVFV